MLRLLAPRKNKIIWFTDSDFGQSLKYKVDFLYICHSI